MRLSDTGKTGKMRRARTRGKRQGREERHRIKDTVTRGRQKEGLRGRGVWVRMTGVTAELTRTKINSIVTGRDGRT